MQGFATLFAILAAPWRLGADRDQFRQRGNTQVFDPGQEAGFELLRINRGKQLAERVVAGYAVVVRQEAAKEWQLLPPHNAVSTKSSVPAIVPASASNRISNRG
jgi:hypothetical protein